MDFAGFKINMLAVTLGVGACGAAYLAYTKYNRSKVEHGCPVDHTARQEMVEQGRKQARK